MSRLDMEKKLKKVLEDITPKTASYYTLNNGISRLRTEAIQVFAGESKEDVCEFFDNRDQLFLILSGHYSGYYLKAVCRSVAMAALMALSSDADYILRNTKNEVVIEVGLDEGLYNDIAVVDYLLEKSKGAYKYKAAEIASVDALRKMLGKGDKKIRAIVYQRLGPTECLDYMIDDKYCELRQLGYSLAPFGYEKLNEKVGEIAKGPALVLAKKNIF